MEKTSNQPAIAVTLVTGLLGSGKTTTLQALLRQKPDNETWGLLINELGEIPIDSLTLQAPSQPLEVVSGGCICCSAARGYQQALQSLLQYPITRILIEPTGLGHPATIIDQLLQFRSILTIEQILCVVTPQQLTPERWQKSTVLRDLVHLADILLVNKLDTASNQQQLQAQNLLESLYPQKPHLLYSQYAIDPNGQMLPLLQQTRTKHFNPLEGLATHHQQTQQQPLQIHSSLAGCLDIKAYTGDISHIGWRLAPNYQFNRITLQAFLQKTRHLIRAKGVIRTGKEWQLLNHTPDQTDFDDIAWRQDNRLTLILDQPITQEIVTQLEQNLTKTVRNCDA